MKIVVLFIMLILHIQIGTVLNRNNLKKCNFLMALQ